MKIEDNEGVDQQQWDSVEANAGDIMDNQEANKKEFKKIQEANNVQEQAIKANTQAIQENTSIIKVSNDDDISDEQQLNKAVQDIKAI